MQQIAIIADQQIAGLPFMHVDELFARRVPEQFP